MKKCKYCGDKIRNIDRINNDFCSTDCRMKDYHKIIGEIKKLENKLKKYHPKSKILD